MYLVCTANYSKKQIARSTFKERDSRSKSTGATSLGLTMHNFVALNHSCSMMTETRHEIASIAVDKSIIHTFVKLEFSLAVAIARVLLPAAIPTDKNGCLVGGYFIIIICSYF